MNRYVIIDAAVARDAPVALGRFAEPITYRSLFTETPEADHSSIGPWLVLQPSGDYFQHWIRGIQMLSPNALTFITSPHPFRDAYMHLQRLLNLKLSNGSSALLRYYDPRVMAQLQRVLTTDQLRTLMGPFVEWQTCQGRYTYD